MSCFWKGILNALSTEFKAKHELRDPSTLLSFFKTINNIDLFYRKVNGSLVPVVQHQNTLLSETQILENIKWVNEYQPSVLNQGHYTSTCDPFLLLLACYCGCSIEHVYMERHRIRYTNGFNHSNLWLIFKSNKGHFWFVGREHRAKHT